MTDQTILELIMLFLIFMGGFFLGYGLAYKKKDKGIRIGSGHLGVVEHSLEKENER